ncbi:glycosyltransferase family 4 protein [Melioribacteraceae bacterium 4301-Me]|uniref:glycosyltransferase family 4 protein n=1 Tax=Pyranulibacter aquaticus TaxID=3163344 RepID=UPI003597E837
MSQSKIKILMMIDEAKIGGGQQHLLWLTQRLDKSKFDVEVACEKSGYLVDELNKIGVKVHPLKISNRPNIFSLIKTYQLIKKISPDILHTHGGTAGFYGRLAAIKNFKGAVIHTYHGIHYLNFDKPLQKKIYTVIDKFLLKFTHCTICVAKNDFELGMKYGIVRKEKSAVIFNGVDIDQFTQSNQIEKSTIKLKISNTTIIGSVGRLHPQKGYEYLIKASEDVIKNYQNVRFVIVGDGELRNDLELLAKKSKVENYFTFLGSRTDIPSLIKQFDIFVLPSLWEGLPLVLLEAMASKKPIVATNVNGITEIIENGKEGILIPPKNYQALSKAIIHLLNNKQLCEQLAEQAFKKVSREFSLNKMINETEKIYLKCYYNETFEK